MERGGNSRRTYRDVAIDAVYTLNRCDGRVDRNFKAFYAAWYRAELRILSLFKCCHQCIKFFHFLGQSLGRKKGVARMSLALYCSTSADADAHCLVCWLCNLCATFTYKDRFRFSNKACTIGEKEKKK